MTNDEELQVLLRLKKDGYNYISRNKDNSLWVYKTDNKIVKGQIMWLIYPDYKFLDSSTLKFITWEQKMPTQIDEAIKYLKDEDTLESLPSPFYDSHYVAKIQPIEVMQEHMSNEEFIGFLKGNIIKYACRLGKKDGVEKEAAKIFRYAEWLLKATKGETIDPRK